MVMTMMPMPPSQWVRLRQKRRLSGRPSIAVRTLAPVVVNPDRASNRQSRYPGNICHRDKTAARRNTPAENHPRATTAIPSRCRTSSRLPISCGQGQDGPGNGRDGHGFRQESPERAVPINDGHGYGDDHDQGQNQVQNADEMQGDSGDSRVEQPLDGKCFFNLGHGFALGKDDNVILALE